jgi:hypothetical protein
MGASPVNANLIVTQIKGPAKKQYCKAVGAFSDPVEDNRNM